MNKANELEGIEHPYELEYSSLKSSKNESLKIQSIKDNNNLLNINNSNYNYPGINNNTLFQHNSNSINIQNNENIKQRNGNTNNISNIKKI
jgi:hypothetical protein